MADRAAGRLRYVWADDIVPEVGEPGLVDGVLEPKGMTIIYGPSGAGKTAVGVDLSCRIAAKMHWRTCPTKGGIVVYFAAENSDSTQKRVWAWKHRWGVEELPLAVVKTPLVMDAGGVKEIALLVKQVQDEKSEQVSFVVLDTLARTLKGDENQAEDMGEYVRACDAVRDQTDGHVAVVHHAGKNEARGARGSSALKAATDHEIEITKPHDSKIGSITLTKVREGEMQGQRFGYELRPYMLGRNSLNREVTTPVIEECAAPAKRRGRGQQHETLVEEFFANAEGRVTEKHLRRSIQLTESGNPNSERGAWKRLIEKGFISVDEDGIVTLE